MPTEPYRMHGEDRGGGGGGGGSDEDEEEGMEWVVTASDASCEQDRQRGWKNDKKRA